MLQQLFSLFMNRFMFTFDLENGFEVFTDLLVAM